MSADLERQFADPPAAVDLFRQILARAPVSVREKVVREALEGRDAARRGEARNEPVDPAGDTPANELLEAGQRANRIKALRECLPPDRAQVAGRGLAGLDADQHPVELAAWLADPYALMLVLAGTTGPGKTMAAYCTAAEATLTGAMMRDRHDVARRRELLVRAWAVNDYLAQLRPEGSPEPVWQIRNRACQAELLILDDLGAEDDAEVREFVRKEIVSVLEHRHEFRLRTVVTTNLRSPHIRERFGPRLFSRLVKQATVLTFLGPDRRNLQNLEW